MLTDDEIRAIARILGRYINLGNTVISGRLLGDITEALESTLKEMNENVDRVNVVFDPTLRCLDINIILRTPTEIRTIEAKFPC
jgi:hypothetical protein